MRHVSVVEASARTSSTRVVAIGRIAAQTAVPELVGDGAVLVRIVEGRLQPRSTVAASLGFRSSDAAHDVFAPSSVRCRLLRRCARPVGAKVRIVLRPPGDRRVEQITSRVLDENLCSQSPPSSTCRFLLGIVVCRDPVSAPAGVSAVGPCGWRARHQTAGEVDRVLRGRGPVEVPLIRNSPKSAG